MPQPARVAHCGRRTKTASSTAFTGQNIARKLPGRLTMPSRHRVNTNKKMMSAGQIFRVSDNEVVCILDPETSASIKWQSVRVTTVGGEAKINGRPAYYCQFCLPGHLFIHQGKIYLCINILTGIILPANKLPRPSRHCDRYCHPSDFLPAKSPPFSLMAKLNRAMKGYRYSPLFKTHK